MKFLKKLFQISGKLILGTILTLIFFEGMARGGVAAARLIYRRDLGWAMMAIKHGFAYNRINPPPNPIPNAIDPGETLVVCLGGSTTQGISGLDWSGKNHIPATNWPDMLQQLIDASPKKNKQKIRVLNLAKTSMLSNYHIQIIEQLEAKKIKPAVVIWNACLNDGAVLIESPRIGHESGDFASVLDDNNKLFSTTQFLPPTVRLDAVLERYCFTYHLLGRLARSLTPVSEGNVLQVRQKDVQIALKNYRLNLGKLKAWADRSGTRLILCSEPLPVAKEDRTGGGTPYSHLLAPKDIICNAAKEFAEKNQLTFADLSNYIQSSGEDPQIYLQDHVHYTPYGNKKIAAYLLPLLEKELADKKP